MKRVLPAIVMLAILSTAACAQLLTDYDGNGATAGNFFKQPYYSASTSGKLAKYETSVCAIVANPAGDGQSLKLHWGWAAASGDNWLRLTTADANPSIPVHAILHMDVYLPAGSPALGLAIGIRETNATAAFGTDGGKQGSMEWIGATAGTQTAGPTCVNVISPMNAWQTISIDFTTAPVAAFTGNGKLDPITNMVVLEHLAFKDIAGTTTPVTVYLDNIRFEAVPEPSSILAFGTGLIGLVGLVIRKRA